MLPWGPAAKHGKKNSTETVDELVEAECRLARKYEAPVTLDVGLGFIAIANIVSHTLHLTAGATEW